MTETKCRREGRGRGRSCLQRLMLVVWFHGRLVRRRRSEGTGCWCRAKGWRWLLPHVTMGCCCCGCCCGTKDWVKWRELKICFEINSIEQPVQGISVFLLTTNMRLFLNPIINDIFSPILICEKPFLYIIFFFPFWNFKCIKRLTDKLLEQVQGIGWRSKH